MRQATPALVALLNGAQRLAYADLYTITLLGGGVLRYTSADQPVTHAGHAYALGPLISRSRTKLSIGISVDDLDVTVHAGPEVQVNGRPLLAFIAAGGLDGARLRLERIFRADWSTPPAGALMLFGGRISDVSLGRYEARLIVRSDTELLDAKVPRNLYQPGCSATLYDAACGVSRTARTVASAVAASPAPSALAFAAPLAQAAGYFDLGVVTFSAGANAGVARTIKAYGPGGLITLIAPFPYPPAAGDAFAIYPGCDKTAATCVGRFGNLARYRGQPYIPVPETVT